MADQTTPAAELIGGLINEVDEEFPTTLADAEAGMRRIAARRPKGPHGLLLAEYERRGAIEARYVAQVNRVLPHVPGPDPDDPTEDFDERVIAELERLRGVEQRAVEGDVHADERTDALLRWILHGLDDDAARADSRATGIRLELERLRDRLAEQEAGPVVYGVRWPDRPDKVDRYEVREEAADVVRQFPGAVLVQARRGPWEVVSS